MVTSLRTMEFELPALATILLAMLCYFYFSKKRVSLIENKTYEVMLIASLISSTIDTFIHIICASHTYEQVEIDKSQISNEVKFLKEGLEVILYFYENEMLGIELPEKIDFKIIQTEPAVKGNTATNATKDAIIETGYLVKVPLFIEQDEEIIVSTKDGKYVSRK